ncbi:DUF2293 domain-containing protein [Telmatospirillum siberiense]|uniref:DUF2293 domain-containing protein n=1 Tax=Telmatospirillum siberiense TaxID=382514 RepID=A0A2N3PR55_9PROT|nr:DUF2293 domain-containing protein [Telmatospirillum siberiense]PKU22887.1 DUF2293 domain-containing protein [Telmatospirillum siberiense]
MRRRTLLAAELAALAPLTPEGERQLILDHAEDSSGLRKALPSKAAWLSLVAFIRHNYSDYDTLLRDGYDVASARHFCLDEMNEVLRAWGCRRLVDGNSDD